MEARVPADEEENEQEEFILIGLKANTKYYAYIAAYYDDHVSPKWAGLPDPPYRWTFSLPTPENLACQPLSSSTIQLTWTHPFADNPTKGFKVFQTTEGNPDPELVLDVQDPDLREATFEVPYPSTQYTYQMIAYDGQVDHNESEPSNPASAFTHPFLSARVNHSLDPSNSSKFADKGDKVYLVHEDQDRVWLAIGTKALGKIVWEEQKLQGANLHGLRTALRCHPSPCTARGYELRLVSQAFCETPSFPLGTTDLRRGYYLTQDREILYAVWDEQDGG